MAGEQSRGERELVALILQFLREQNWHEAALYLEKESGVHFNLENFLDMILAGNWERAEWYLHGFFPRGIAESNIAAKIFFEVYKHKYLEALDRCDDKMAREVLLKDIKQFELLNRSVVEELTSLMRLENFREHKNLALYGDKKTGRDVLCQELARVIEMEPSLKGRLQFPEIRPGRLFELIEQSFLWQRHWHNHPSPNPVMNTLPADHRGPQPYFGPSPAHTTLTMSLGPIPAVSNQPESAAHSPSLAGCSPNSNYHLGGCRTRMSTGLSANHPVVEYRQPQKKRRRIEHTKEVIMPTGDLPVEHKNIKRDLHEEVDLPKTLLMKLDQGSTVVTMDFHPTQPTVLLVGTSVGDISIWELAAKTRIPDRNFISLALKTDLAREPAISVKRVRWNSDGSLFGVAFSKDIVHLYKYCFDNEFVNPLEINAHKGAVNDIVFAPLNRVEYAVTCGDDMAVKVWNATNGSIIYTCADHVAPVHSVCEISKLKYSLIISAATDGKVIVWQHGGNKPPIGIDFDIPAYCRTAMAYSSDGTRVFSCGTGDDGRSYLVEWDETTGRVKCSYTGLQRHGAIQFDAAKNHFLAAGDDFKVKFWDMNNGMLLTTTNAEGELPILPRVCFSKDGSLLAVTTDNNCIKVLANADGQRLLRQNEAFVHPGPTFDSYLENGSVGVVRATKIEDSKENPEAWNLNEVDSASKFCTLTLPDDSKLDKVRKLIYWNSGDTILTLTSSALLKLWKWKIAENNTSGKATASVLPQLMEPGNGMLPLDGPTGKEIEEAVCSFTMTRNDSYAMSSFGGILSLCFTCKFEEWTTMKALRHAATCISLDPENQNIVAIGIEDFTILIYEVKYDQISTELKGHNKRITGLDFSRKLNMLVSSGADAKVCFWNRQPWGIRSNIFLELPEGYVPCHLVETKVQFHCDDVHLLVVHEKQIAIFDATNAKLLQKWLPQDGFITYATYSCNSEMIYTTFMDGNVRIFTETLQPLRQIKPTVYRNSQSLNAYPLVVASHPSKPTQFALGLSDGGVQVFEPLESEGQWGRTTPLLENGATENDAPVLSDDSSSNQHQNDES